MRVKALKHQDPSSKIGKKPRIHSMSAGSQEVEAKEPGHQSDYHKSFLARVERNQILISRSILLALYLLHNLIPMLLPYTSRFIHLQYKIGHGNNGKPVYDIGFNDVYYVSYLVIMLTFLRSVFMQQVFVPIAQNVFDIKSKKAKIRFAEQSWCYIYYSFSFFFGGYLYVNSEYFLDLDHIYIGWPHFQMSGPFKTYYLMAMAFWLQQIYVLHIEEKRKDHYQMLSHHIITCCLIIGSYYYYYVRIGNLILMIMDSVDTLLAAAKLLKYAGYNTACDFMFMLFLMAWTSLRHGLYCYLYYHAYGRARSLMTDAKCIEGVVQKRCWNNTIVTGFLALLGGLQFIILIWMYLICKVAYKVLSGKGAEDVRSDAEDTDDE